MRALRPSRFLARLTTLALVVAATSCGGDSDGPTPAEVPATVSVSPIELTVEAGKTAALQATVANASGSTISGARVSWSTSNAATATVSQTGVVTGVASGVARITATAGTISGSTVAAVSTALANPQSVGPAGGTVSTPGGEVKVSLPNGALPAGGTVTITPITTGNPPGTTVPGTVYKVGVFGITVGPRPTITVRYSVEGLPAGFDERKLVLSRKVGVFWIPLPTVVDVTAKTMTATLPAGFITSATFASASIAAALNAADEEFIVGAALFTFQTSPAAIQLTVGDTRRLTGQVVTLATGASVAINSPTASSSSPNVAAITGAPTITGNDVGVDVRAVAPGTAAITFGASTGSGANAAPFAGVVNVTVASPTSLALTITGLPDGVNAAVTVTGPGNFSQSATASRTFSGIATGTYAVAALPVLASGVTYGPTPANQSVVVNAGESKTATVAYAPTTGGLTVNITGLPNGVNGSVNVTGPGGFARGVTATTTITTIAPGQYTVAASAVPVATGSYGPNPATQSVTVTAGQTATANVAYTFAAPCASVDVSPSPISVIVGQTVQLTTTPRDANRNALTGRTVTFSSSNTAIMAVNSAGLVTGVAVGQATLTLRCESATSQFLVTVTAVPVSSVVVTPSTFRAFIGDTVQLTAVARDGSGNVLSNRVITWASSNVNVASVQGAGTVISRSPGNVTVSATSEGRTGSSAGVLGCFVGGTVVTCGTLNVAVQTPGSTVIGQRSVVNGYGHLRCLFNITFVPTGGDAGTWINDVPNWVWNGLEIRSGTNIPGFVDYYQDWQVDGQPAYPPFQINLTWRYRINSSGQIRSVSMPTVTCQ